MPVKQLKEFLDRNKIKYVSIKHSLAYTAQEIASSSHIPGKEMAKVVIIKIKNKMAMVVLPSYEQIDFNLLRSFCGTDDIELAHEREFKDMFPECEVGAMPPFGNLYGMDVFVSESLKENKEIAFNAGSHTELIKLSYTDFERLVKQTVVKL